MSMLAFVFLGPIAYIGRSSGNQNRVVLTTKSYGSLRESDIRHLLNQRQIVFQFLTRVAEAVGVANSKQQKASEPKLGAAALEMRREIGERIGEREVVNSWLLMRRAMQLGLTVDDQAINNFIDRIGENRLSDVQVRNILLRMGVSQTLLFESLRNELLPLEFERMFRLELGGLTPSQQWDGFLRLHRLARIEATPVAVSQFLDQVPDPSEREIAAFFNEHKHRDYDPNSAEVGFHQPHRVDIQYFKIDYDRFFKLEAVTDQQIKDAYEESKDRLYKEEKKTEQPQPPTAAKPAASPKPAVSAKPAESPKPHPAAPAQKSATSGAGEKPETKPAAQPAKQSGKSSSIPARSPFSLTAFQVDESQAKKNAPAPAAKGEALSKPQPESKPRTPGISPQLEKSAAQPAPKADLPAAKASQASTSAPAAPQQYIPLEKVKDEIRRRIATKQAEDEQKKAVDALKEELEKYRTRLLDYEQLNEEQRARTSPPPLPNFAELAKKYGVADYDTGLVSEAEAKDLEIARSYLPGRKFLQAAFGQLNTFQPAVAADSPLYYQDGLRYGQFALYVQPTTIYLFWKTEDVKAATPDLKDPETRSLVVKQWKLRKARTLAKESAGTRVLQASDAKKPLRDVFAGKEGKTVVEPPPFGWMSSRSVPGSPLELTQVPGIDHAGMEFMRSVFQLQPGQIGLALDQPETTVYVVRLVAYTPTEDALWQQFSAEAANMSTLGSLYYEAFSALYPDLQTALAAWTEDLSKQAGLRWVREPAETRTVSDYGE